MTLIISISGGIASAVNAILAAESGEPFIMFFADTSIEDDDLHRFLYDIERFVGQPIYRLRDGRDPWGVFVDVKYIGNSRTAHCSQKLKTDQVKFWSDAWCAPTDPIILGMYLDEADRLERAAKNWSPRPVRSLLIERKITPGEAGDMIDRIGIKRPRLYDMGFPHNNCGGMCVRVGQGQFARLLETRPAFYARQEQRNEWARKTIGPTAGGFIRVQRNGVTEYLHMKEFRERVQSGELKPARYEMGGCGCFVDDV